MNRKLFVVRIAALVSALLLALVVNANAETFSALGKARVGGEDVFVEVYVVVHPGANRHEIARAALAAQGAVQVEEFTTTGLVWPSFPVVQNYNPAGEPVVTAQAALLATHATWTSVATSRASMVSGGVTTRCPSLVQECPGAQTIDGFDDVGWLPISGCCTLGVTWYSTSLLEADMALNTNFSWADDGVTDFDIETVYLHENGHVLGVGHSSTVGAVMEPIYAGVRDALHTDDIAAVTALYPEVSGTTTTTTSTTTTSTSTTTTTTLVSGCFPRFHTCVVNSDCCSNRCGGKTGSKTCKPAK